MKEDSDLLEPCLPDEEYGEPKLVCRFSYQEKLWELLLQGPAVLWQDIKNSIKYDISFFPRKCLMPEPLIKRRTMALILVAFILFTVIGGILVWHNLPIREQHPPTVDHFKADPGEPIIATLLKVRKSKPHGVVKNCLDKAIKEFILEPNIVKENAKMILECNGTRKEFVSGKGENYIEVFWVDNQTYYTVKEASSKVYLARHQPLPLSLASILKVYQGLASYEDSEELQQCLYKVIEEFPKEPRVVQDNAKLVVSCGEDNVTFRSTAGENEISVFKDKHGTIQFNVKCTGLACWARFFTRGKVK